MLKMLLRRWAHYSSLPYARELWRIVDEAETWEDCETAVGELIRVAGVDVPSDTNIEQDYHIALQAMGLEFPEMKGEGRSLIRRVLIG